jgi:hypothetical protein
MLYYRISASVVFYTAAKLRYNQITSIINVKTSNGDSEPIQQFEPE